MSVACWALLDILIIGNGCTRVDYRGLCVYVLEVKKRFHLWSIEVGQNSIDKCFFGIHLKEQ